MNSLLNVFYRRAILASFSLWLLPIGAIASPDLARGETLQVSQNLDNTRIRTAAQQALLEAEELIKQETVASQTSAIAKYQESLRLWRQLGDRNFEGLTLRRLGFAYLSMGETKLAIDTLTQALEPIRAEKDTSAEAETLQTLGLAYLASGQYPLALETLDRALPLLAENPLGEALTSIALGGVHDSLGNFQRSLELYQRALAVYQAAELHSLEGETLNNIGRIYERMGEGKQALEVYQQALALQQAPEDKARKAFTLNNIGGIYKAWGESQQALDTYNQAIKLQQEAGDRTGVANTLVYIADVHSALGDYPGSLEAYNQALSAWKETGNRTGIGQTLDSIGTIQRLNGDYPASIDAYQQALAIWREVGDRFREAATQTNLIRAYDSAGNYAQALETAKQAQKLFQAQQDKSGEATALGQMGRVYASMGQNRQALEVTNQARSLFQAAKSRLGEATSLDRIGSLYETADPQQALKAYNQALAIWQQLGDASGQANTLYQLANVYRQQGNLQQARSQIESALTIVESLRTKVASNELRTAYFASVQKYYQFYIDLLMQLHKSNPSQGYDALALHASERARARSLLELLAEAGADIRQGVDPALLDRDRAVNQKLDTLERQRIERFNRDGENAQLAALQAEIDALVKESQKINAEIRATSPRFAALTQPQPLTLSEIQSQVLDENTVLLEYFLGSDRSYLWFVTKTGIQSYELPKREEIETAAKAFRDALTNRRMASIPQLANDAATELSQLILQAVANQLGKKRLLVVSDGALQYIPFAALTTSSGEYTPLVANHEIVNLPSASALAVLRQDTRGRKPATKAIALLADPVFSQSDERLQVATTPTVSDNVLPVQAQQIDRAAKAAGISWSRLPATRLEADAIAALIPPSERLQALDFQANLLKATSTDLADYRIVHFATHGFVNSVNPELSGIVLSLVDEKGLPQNGFLRLHEIYNLNLNAELVVLSACQTGLGKEIRGEGIVGLTRGFMYAGAKRVTVSLWSVDDEGTKELMSRFYRNMLQQNLSPAAALRAAQIEMSQQPQWRSPYYWAAFTLQGEWK